MFEIAMQIVGIIVGGAVAVVAVAGTVYIVVNIIRDLRGGW